MTEQVPLLALITEFESGARPKGGASAETGEVISLGAEHLTDDGSFSFKSPKRIPQTFYASLRSGRIKKDDILIVKDGATTGKTSYVGEEFPFSEAAINEHVFRIAIDANRASPRYIYNYLVSSEGQKRILADFRGATVGGIGRTFAEKVLIPLPPLNEQRRIAAILDKANALRRKRKCVLALLDSITMSVFNEMFGDPKKPANLTVENLGKVAQFYSGNSLPSGQRFTGQKDGFLLMKVSDLNSPGNAESVVTAAEWSATRGSNAGTCDRDAVLFPKRGGAIATNKKRKLTRPSILDPNLMAVAPLPGAMTIDYLFTWFRFLRLEEISSGSSVPQLNKQDLEPLKIAVPSLGEQYKFSAICASVKAGHDSVLASLQKSECLFTSLQHRAFSGQL